MSFRKKWPFLCLLAMSISALCTEDFSGFETGSMPPKPQWGTTAGKQWKVVDSGDDHGKALEISGGEQCFGRYNFPVPYPKDATGVLIEFDFKAAGAGNQEIGLLDSSFKLADYFSEAVFRLKINGKSGTVQFFERKEWITLGEFDKGNWNHLRLVLRLSETDGAEVSVALNGKEMDKIPLRIDGGKPRFERLWFTDQTGGRADKLLIDNIDLEYLTNETVPAQAMQESPERVKAFSFYSDALNKEQHCFIILPPKFNKNEGKKYPLLMILHGRGRNAKSLLQEPNSLRALLNFRGVVLLVQGDDGWYIDSPVRKKARYGAMMKELIGKAKEELPVSPARQAWGIAGWSMGAYGAAMTAEAHPDCFSSVALLIGLLDYPREGLPKKQSYAVVVDHFGKDPAVWNRYNPIKGMDKLSGMKIFMRTGAYSFDLIMNRNFCARARELKIPCDYKELPGGHEFPLVCRAMRDVVNFMNSSLKQL